MTSLALVTSDELQGLAFAHGAQIEVDNAKGLMTCRIGSTEFRARLAQTQPTGYDAPTVGGVA